MSCVVNVLKWLVFWLGYVGLILLAGTVLGILSHLLIGGLLLGKGLLTMVEVGAKHGFLYSGVWAGGVAIVLCFMHGHRESRKRAHVGTASTVPGGRAEKAG